MKRRDRSKTIAFRLKTKELRTWGKELEAHVYPSGGTGEGILKGIEGLVNISQGVLAHFPNSSTQEAEAKNLRRRVLGGHSP